MEHRTRRLGINTILVFGGKAGSSLISLLMLPFYTHWLSPKDYGTTDLVFTYTSILISVISCCLSDAVFVYAKGATEYDRKKYFTSGILFLFLSFIFYMFISLFFKYIGLYIESTSVIFEYMWFILAITVCSVLQQYAQAYTQAIDKMLIFTLTGVVFTISIALLSFCLLPYWGLKGYLYSYVIANLVASLFTFIFSKSYKDISLKLFDLQKCKTLLHYGIPIIPNTIMWWLVSGINRPIMESKLGLAAIGLFAVANKIPGVISMLCTVFNTAWSITVLEEYNKDDFNVFFNRIVKSIFFILVIVGVLISIFSKELIRIFASDEFFPAWRYVPFLVFGVLLQNLSSLIGGVFSANKQSKYFFYSSIWGAVTSVIFTFLLIPKFAMYGVCVAMIISFCSMVIARLIYTWKDINKFDIKYYIVISVLYILLSIVVVVQVDTVLKVLLFVLILSLMTIISKDVVIDILSLINMLKNKVSIFR